MTSLPFLLQCFGHPSFVISSGAALEPLPSESWAGGRGDPHGGPQGLTSLSFARRASAWMLHVALS